jgi:hypothetical protein
MDSAWTAEITNDPDRDYILYVELLEDDEYRGRIVRDDRGCLVLVIYGQGSLLNIPALWLCDILERAESDLIVTRSTDSSAE